MTLTVPVSPRHARLSTLEWTGLSFLYWVVFMGALTPGNIGHALDAGVAPNLLFEAIRLCLAGALGASVTPLLLWLAEKAPVAGKPARRNLALQGAAIVALSVALIVVSCFLAEWAFWGRPWPSPVVVYEQLFANTLLLVLCNALLLGAIQVVPRLHGEGRGSNWQSQLTLGERGRLKIVDLRTVEWIEAQGNYQAIHADDGVHLYRGTSARIEAMLDPAQFVRIHRRHLVARTRISAVEPLPSGDATITMHSGARLRQSRRYRSALRAVLAGQCQEPRSELDR